MVTDTPDPAPWLRSEKRKNGWFVIERVGAALMEYGPIKEEHVDGLMNEIRVRAKTTAAIAEDERKEKLRVGLSGPGSTPRAFNPAMESQWLQKRKPR
jgi:hypothetical protein